MADISEAWAPLESVYLAVGYMRHTGHWVKACLYEGWLCMHYSPHLLVPWTCGSNFTIVFFELILSIDILSTSCEIGLRWVSQDPINVTSTLIQVMAGAFRQHWSTLVQVMVCCHQATSHYLRQCGLMLTQISGHNEFWFDDVLAFVYGWFLSVY